MSKTIQIRIDDDTKAAVDELFESLGIDTTTATRMFYKAALLHQGIPFEVRAGNKPTMTANNGELLAMAKRIIDENRPALEELAK